MDMEVSENMSGENDLIEGNQSAVPQNQFAAIVEDHANDFVQLMIAEHERIVRVLHEENQKLQAKLVAPRDVVVCNAAVDGVWNKPVELQSERQSASARSLASGGRITSKASSSSDASLDSAADEDQRSWKVHVKRLIRSGRFDSIVGGIIVLNTLVMSLELEYHGRKFEEEVIKACVKNTCEVQSDVTEAIFDTFEHFFTAAFALELIIRLLVQGCGYLRHLSNSFDALIVVVSMADSWMPLGGDGSDVLGSVAVLRLMRLMRLAKVLRVVRVMKAFKSLRVLVSAVMNSVGALGWSMTLLFVLMLLGAIFMAQVIQPFMEETTDKDLRQYIWSRFGTWTNAMFTVFEITMAPGGFIQYRRLYEEVHPLFGIFCMLYVCLVTFAVVRVITAMFLKTTLSASDSEEQATAREKSKEWSEYVRSFEKMTDTSGTGTISLKEIDALLQTDKFSHWMDEAGLAPSEIVRIFVSLDGGGGDVLLSDFETALQHMLGLPRAADVVINLYETRHIMHRVMRLESWLLNRPNAGKKSLGNCFNPSASQASVDAMVSRNRDEYFRNGDDYQSTGTLTAISNHHVSVVGL